MIMIQPYLVFHNRVYKTIYLGFLKTLNTDFRSKARRRTREVWTFRESAEYIYLVEVLHVKSLSPLVKYDGSYILHFILMYCGLWV